MNTTSISTSGMHNVHARSEFFAALLHGLHKMYSALNQMGSAIALGEAGDLEGAQMLRNKNAL
jgi:hypothetical protein